MHHHLAANATPEEKAYHHARRYVKRLRGWYLHASVYALVIGFLWLRFATDGFGQLWPWRHASYMPIGVSLGWGLGVLLHGFLVWSKYGRTGPLGRSWEERKIQEYLQKT